MLSGVVAGLIAKTAVYPLDVMKKRLQVQGFHQHRVGFGEVRSLPGYLMVAVGPCSRPVSRPLSPATNDDKTPVRVSF